MITIHTDASFCPHKKVGGYAFWIASDLGRIKYSNRFKGTLSNSSEAEMRCIINALNCISNIPTDKIVVYTDCTTAIKALSSRYSGVIFRHVEAHQNEPIDKQSKINNWCDKMAKNELSCARLGMKPKYAKPKWK